MLAAAVLSLKAAKMPNNDTINKMIPTTNHNVINVSSPSDIR